MRQPDANSRSPSRNARWMPSNTVAKAMPRAVCVCGSKKISVCDAIGMRAAQVGQGQRMEIVLVAQHVGTGVVEIEEGLQVGKIVGRAQRLDVRVLERHAVLLGQREGQLGFERAFDMQMQFGLGDGADEGVDVGSHVCECRPCRARTQTAACAPALKAEIQWSCPQYLCDGNISFS